jgi:anthranilate phosphoribosyltransferase
MSKPSYQPPTPEHPFACYIRILGKGKSGSRSLSQAEARDAFGMILRGATDPLQQGAFLMLLRVKEETGEELAGFVQACRDSMVQPPNTLHADLDWSSYAGKKHQHPWFILSMLLLAQAGYRVFVHGCDGHTPGRLYTEDAMRQLELPVAADWRDTGQQLDCERLSYLPLRHFCYPLHEMMQLRPLLGLRSPVNTLARMINPLRTAASLQSIFHPAYAVLHQQTDSILGQPRALVFKGDSGEVEIKPQADTRLHLLAEGKSSEVALPRSVQERVASADFPSVEPLRALWRGSSSDDYGLDATLATTATALLVLQPGLTLESARRQAGELWRQRDLSRLS